MVHFESAAAELGVTQDILQRLGLRKPADIVQSLLQQLRGHLRLWFGDMLI